MFGALVSLTLLGVFGVLRPLMALGNAMRAVAHSLKDGGEQAFSPLSHLLDMLGTGAK